MKFGNMLVGALAVAASTAQGRSIGIADTHPNPNEARSCSYYGEGFSSPAGNHYAVGQCGYTSGLKHARDRIVSHCNATSQGQQPLSAYWRTVDTWWPVTLKVKEEHVNDPAFLNCVQQYHKSAAPRTAPITGATVGATVVMSVTGSVLLSKLFA